MQDDLAGLVAERNYYFELLSMIVGGAIVAGLAFLAIYKWRRRRRRRARRSSSRLGRRSHMSL